MKILDIDTIETVEEARQLAIDWQQWQADKALSMVQLMVFASYFEDIGKKFNLTDEFKENGII
jgi:hypothetical protein